MYKYILLIIITLCTACNSNKEKKPIDKIKEIDVSVNTTVETFMILRALAANDPLYKYRKNDYKGKPLLYDARVYFEPFKQDSAVTKTQALLATTSNTGDLILQGLLYAEQLPQTELIYHPNAYWKEHLKELKAYLNVLKQFYVKANVEEFIQQHHSFYQGAIKEAKDHLDKRLIGTMEAYFGESNPHYGLIITPISPFGFGFGANVGEGDDKILYQLLSPATDVEWHSSMSQYTLFGYSGTNAANYYRDLVAHEFCHSFITPILKTSAYKEKISQTDSLFIPKLADEMKKQQYGSWWSYVNEYTVRLASIRIEKALGIDDLEEMREDNIVAKKFVLIPDGEQLMITYEENRNVYPTFKKFIPELLANLSTYSKETIALKLEEVDSLAETEK